jgi:hypothetical protein
LGVERLVDVFEQVQAHDAVVCALVLLESGCT